MLAKKISSHSSACSLVSILPELKKAEDMEGVIKYDEGSEIYFRNVLEKIYVV